MKKILRSELFPLLEPHFYNDLVEDTYAVEQIEATTLLTHTRFDLAFKLFYLDMKDKSEKLAQEVYSEHIRAFSLGKYTEPGNLEKNSIEKFIESFEYTFGDMRENGFNASQSIVPLSEDSTIANGAHRVASAIYLNQEVSCVQLDTPSHIYDYRFFYKRNVSDEILDMVASTFAQRANNVYIAFIWPTAQGKDAQVENIIPNIVYRKSIPLTPNGAHNLLSQIYHGEAWLGSVANNFSGSQGKLVECFKCFDPVRVIVFQADNLDVVLEIKERIRALFDVGKHSIHITDTKDEAVRISQMVLNDNSIHFLNYAKPNSYLSTHSKINLFRQFMQSNQLECDDILIDSSMVLSCYGIREAKDIDFLLASPKKIEIHYEDIHEHDEVLVYYQKNRNQIVYDPRNYFYFYGLKLVSFDLLYHMKKNRDEPKDRNDCKMMEAFIDNNTLRALRYSLQQKIFYLQVLLKQKIIKFLERIGLFPVVFAVYKKLKGQHE